MPTLIQYMKNSEFFNEQCFDEMSQLYNLAGIEKQNNFFTYKEFVLDDDCFYIVDVVNELPRRSLDNLSDTEPRCFKYNSELYHFTGKLFCAEPNRNHDPIKIIEYITNIDKNLGEKILEKYYDVAVHSEEVTQYADNMVAMSQVIEDYLRSNHIYLQTFDINYDPTDSTSVTKWFQMIHQKTSDVEEIPCYNDGDYRAYIVRNVDNKEYYVLENFSSDKLFIYDKVNATSGSWFSMSKNDFKDIDDDMHDALYDSNQYVLKNIQDKLNYSTLIAEFNNGKVIKATKGIADLNDLQSYIYGQLYIENKVSLTKNTNFNYMLANYRMDNDFHDDALDEIYFVPFLQAIKEYPGTLYYHNYHYYKTHENMPKSDNIKEKILNKLETQNINYNHLTLLPDKTQSEIVQYIKERMNILPLYDEVKKHLSAIENLLVNNEICVEENLYNDDDFTITIIKP